MRYPWNSKSRPRTRTLRRVSGVAIVVVMLLLFLVVAITTASGLLTRQNYSTESFRTKITQGDYAVRAGLSTALAEMSLDPTWAPTSASPYTEFLDPDNRVGFRVWVEGKNELPSGVVTTSDGIDLQPGQAALRAKALVNGGEVTSGFGGAASTFILMKPEVDFEHAVFQTENSAEFAFVGSNSTILSYDSSGSGPASFPYTGLPAAPSVAHQDTSVKGLGDVLLNNNRVYGDIVLPEEANLTTSGTGGYGGVQRRDETRLPRKFPVQTGGGGYPGTPVLPPGIYHHQVLPPNQTIALERGGEYYIEGSFFLGDNSTLELVGPASAGPVIFYCHDFRTGRNSRVNMPPPGVAPNPKELQIYNVRVPQCSVSFVSIDEDSEISALIAGDETEFFFQDRSTLYGAVAARQVEVGSDVTVHYDTALRGETFPVATEWVLVSNGLR